MDSSAQSLDSLWAFRDSLYRCFERRADALFELTDALLSAGPVPSPPHLSLAAIHRRGWGSRYAALSLGRAHKAGLQELLCRHPLEGAEPGCPPIYAVDVSVWPRCDAEASPGRGYYYHPSRHSAGQPIVAGWAYQLVAQLGFERDSWVAPVDARGLKPTEDTDEVAVEQARVLIGGLPGSALEPIFVFDAGYDPVKLQRGLEGSPARILVRLHSNRVFFYAPPEEVEPRPVGRPPRHGEKFDLKDPSSWPEPAGEHRCESEDYGEVRVRAWSELHPKSRRIAERYGCERAPVVRGTVILVEVGKLPRQTRKPKKHCGCGGALRAMRISICSGRHTAAGSTSNPHHTVPEANPQLDHSPVQAPRAGRPLDLAGLGRLHAAEAVAVHRRRPEAAVGAIATAPAADPDPRP